MTFAQMVAEARLKDYMEGLIEEDEYEDEDDDDERYQAWIDNNME